MSDVAIGLDVGGTKALALIVARDGRVLDEVQVATPHDESNGAGEATAKALTEQIHELCDRHGYDASTVPVGLGLPGLVVETDVWRTPPTCKVLRALTWAPC